MANEPQSPITSFAKVLEQQPSLKQNKVPVFPWRMSQAKNTSARRIVLYPTKSGLPAAASVPDALCDVDQTLAAECWGGNGEVTWALMTWLIQALESQSVGTDLDPNVPGSGPGLYWSLLGADWETEADNSSEGEAVTVFFTIKLSIAALPYDMGHMGVWPTGLVESTSQDFPATRTNTEP